MAEGQYKFGIGLDTRLLQTNIDEARKMFEGLTFAANKSGKGIDDSFVRPIATMQATLRQMPSQVSSTTQSFNGLNVATQQLVRELPAASMGLNTFFLAISNNLPIFADQVKSVAEANKELAAQGKPVTSVFKQILSALLNWQTALVVGVSIVSMYGKEIASWVASLFKGESALNAIARAEQAMHNVRMQGIQSAQEEIAELDLLVTAAQNSALSLEERNIAVRALQDEYPAYFANLTQEQILYGDISDTVDTLVNKMIQLAIARKSLDRLVENEENMATLEGTAYFAQWQAQRDKIAEYISKGGSTERDDDYGFAMQRKLEFLEDKVVDQLKDGNKEQNELWDKIKSDYGKNVGEFVDVIEQSNKKLKESALPLATSPDKAGSKTREQLGAEAEAERIKAQAKRMRAEELSRERNLVELKKQLRIDAERAASQEIVDAMAEGADKERAQVNLDYDLMLADINKREAELKKERGGTLSVGEQRDFDVLRSINETRRARALEAVDAREATQRKESTSRAEADMEEYLSKYGTFKERLLATAERYNQLIADAESEGARMSLEAERDAILAQYEVEASTWAKELVGKTREEINSLISQLQAQVEAKTSAFDAMDSSKGEDAQSLLEDINKLKAQISHLRSLLAQADNESSVSNEDDWDNVAKGFTYVAEAASYAGDCIGSANKGVATFLKTASQMIGSIASSKNLVEGAVSALFTLVKAIGKQHLAQRQLTEDLREYNEELRRTSELSRINSVDGTIFGDDAYGNYLHNIRVMQDALSDFNDAEERILNRPKDYYTEDRSPFGNLADALYGMNIGNSSLGLELPSLFNGNKVDMSLLKEFVDSELFEELSDENQALITELVSQWERYQSAIDATNNYLRGVFGDLGDDMTKALVDAFANGTDAALAFGEAAAGVVEKLATDMVNAAFLQPIIDEYMKEVEALNADTSLSQADRVNALIGIVGNMVADIKDTQADVNNTLEGIRAEGKDQGLDLFESDGRRAEATSGIQVSQDSFDEMSGRVTAIQSGVFNIENNTQSLASSAAAILRHVMNIDNNTQELHAMKQDIRAMRTTIDNFATRGIKTI